MATQSAGRTAAAVGDLVISIIFRDVYQNVG